MRAEREEGGGVLDDLAHILCCEEADVCTTMMCVLSNAEERVVAAPIVVKSRR